MKSRILIGSGETHHTYREGNIWICPVCGYMREEYVNDKGKPRFRTLVPAGDPYAIHTGGYLKITAEATRAEEPNLLDKPKGNG